MKKNSSIRLLVLMLSVFSVTAEASEVLRYNPFDRPDWADSGASTGSAGNGNMKLRGIMLDGEDSLVNIDGKYYRLQEEVSGFLIIQIESGSVTLRRGDNETVLVLKDDK